MEYKSVQQIWTQESVQDQIKTVLKNIGSLLIEKNRKYGNSAICPVRIFSRSDSEEQIKVRIDDKLTRISNHQNDEDEDVYLDLVGYLILLMVNRNLKNIEREFEMYENGQSGKQVESKKGTVISD